MSFVFKAIPHSSSPIVHDGIGLDVDTANLKRAERLHLVEKNRVDAFRGLAFHNALEAIGMGIDGDGCLMGQHFQTLHMVDMVVRDQNSLDAAHGQVVLRQAFDNLQCADARVDEHTLVLLPHKIAIAATARGKAAKDEGGKE